MQNSKTFRIHFWLKKPAVLKNGEIPIYARITVDGKRADVSVKRSTFESRWCGASGRLNPRHKESKSINEYLKDVYAKLLDCHKQLHAENALITAQSIKARYLGTDKPVSTLSELISYHNERELPKLRPGTSKNYFATEKYLMRFIKSKYRLNDIKLLQLDYSFVMKFDHYLRNCKPLCSRQPLNNNGIMKHMERFQRILNIAYKFGWIKQNPFLQYKLKFEQYESAYLEASEIDTIESMEIPELGMRMVRDIFIFSCYTGLGYIEVKLLKEGDIVQGVDGEDWIDVYRKKTKTPVKVPLLVKAKNILDRYSDFPKSNIENKLLPVYSNQKVNQYLKLIAKRAGIEKNLTFHVARHTFATTITLLNDVPLETVSKLLGHTKLSTTQRYARVVEQKISKDMSSLKNILDPRRVQKYNYKDTSHSHLKVLE